MFDSTFTFDTTTATPRSLSLSSSSDFTGEPSRSVSPCTVGISTYPPPRFSVTDLAASFATSRIRHDAQICYDSCEAYANLGDDEEGWTIPGPDDDCSHPITTTPRTPRTLPQRAHSPSRRMARQINSRLLCSSSLHVKDIAALLEQMVDREDCCNVTSDAMHRAGGDCVDSDEGYSICSALTAQRSRLDARRTSDLSLATGARVCKAVRQKRQLKDGAERRLRNGGESLRVQ